MSKKNFKINPKVWPKEYTFEEFKQLNPNISENLLINYYNKYLQEYAENRSRHLKHFDNKKDNLSKELNLLNEKLINNVSEWSDGDINVGPTGAGRSYRSPLDQNKNALYFDYVDDVIHLNHLDVGRAPADGTLKPYKGLTVSTWVNLTQVRTETNTGRVFTIVSAFDSHTGYRIHWQNYRLIFTVVHDDGDGTGGNALTQTAYKQLFAPFRQLYRPDGWHHVVGTWDGKKQRIYVDGRLANDSGDTGSYAYNHTEAEWDVYDGGGFASGPSSGYGSEGVLDTDYQITSGSIGSIYYSECGSCSTYIRNNHLVNVSVGGRADTAADGSHYQNTEFFSGSIAEVAIWDEGLDAATVSELYHNGISGSNTPKYSINHKGYNPKNPSDDIYDLADEGLSYKNVGRYADSLQGWWRFEEGTGAVAQDISGNNREGTIYNEPAWSSSYAPGINPVPHGTY